MHTLRSIALLVLLSALFYRTDVRAAPTPTGRIQVSMSGFRSDRGRAYVALWRSAQGFPGKPPRDAPNQDVRIVKGRASASFDDVAAGSFAITVFHDEDGDTELKESLFGIPKEGIGFSRDVKPRFRAPRFDEAKLELAPGASLQVNIKLLYL